MVIAIWEACKTAARTLISTICSYSLNKMLIVFAVGVSHELNFLTAFWKDILEKSFLYFFLICIIFSYNSLAQISILFVSNFKYFSVSRVGKRCATSSVETLHNTGIKLCLSVFPNARPISTGVQKLSKKAGVIIRIVHKAVATPFSTASKIVSPANISVASSQTSILFFSSFWTNSYTIFSLSFDECDIKASNIL